MAYKLLPKQPAAPKETALSEAHRLPAQALKGAAAEVPGFFGDVASFLNTTVAGPLTKTITGKESVPYEETPLGKILPTSATHRKNLEEGIPYLKPRNKLEKFASDVGEDATALLMPGKGLTKIGLRATKPFGASLVSLGANLGEQVVTGITGDDKKGSYAKMGLMFLFSGMNKPKATQEISNLYKQADKLLPKNATTSGKSLKNDMEGLIKQVLSGRKPKDLAPSEKFVVDEAETILRQIKNGSVNVETLKASTRSLNEKLTKAVFDAPDKPSRARARKLATQINRSVNKTLATYGKTNPKWWNLQKSANEAFGAMEQSNFVSNYIKNNVKGNVITHGLLHAIGAGTSLATGILPYQALKILYRIYKSPTLSKHYARIVGSAAAENSIQMNKEIKELDKKLENDKSKKKFRIINQ